MFLNKSKVISLATQNIRAFSVTGCSDEDENSNPMVPDMGNGAMPKVVHASPDAANLDIGVVDNKAFTPRPNLTDVGLGVASDAAGLSVPAAALTLGVAVTGPTDPAATFDVNLSPGSHGGTGEGFRLMLVDTTDIPWVAASVLPNPSN